MSSHTPPDQPEDAALRQAILKAGTVRFATGTFSQKQYSNGAVSPVEHKVQEVVEIGIDDLMQLFHAHERQAMQTARIEGAKTPITQYDEVTAIAVKELCETRLRMLQPTQPPAADTTKQREGE